MVPQGAGLKNSSVGEMEMHKVHVCFLKMLRASLREEALTEAMDLSEEEWREIQELASIHKVLPMIFEAAYQLPELTALPEFGVRKRNVFQQVMTQSMKTRDYLMLSKHLEKSGVTPLVVKGIICRNLYPQPDHRPSGDEDVLIPAAQFDACHSAMEAFGMQTRETGERLETEYEIPYFKDGSPLYIELHKYLFPPESEAYGDLNRFFEGVFDRAVTETIYGVPVRTMEYTDHLFYLICHAFKHFLHSGFGIRQVCDIVLYANSYGNRVDWQKLLDNCREIRADVFAAAVFRLGENHLTFDRQKACYPEIWSSIAVDEMAMLEDLLSGGVYGGVTATRRRSSNMTLEAVASEKQGRKSGNGVMASLFPSAKKLEGRYTYLKKHPYLLPVAWCHRIVKYKNDTGKNKESHVLEAMKIGNHRIELMRQYGIIK